MREGCATTIGGINIGVKDASRLCTTDGAGFVVASWRLFAAITVEVIGVVIPLVNSAAAEVFTLDNPDEFLDGVVEIELNLNVDVCGRFITSEL